MKQQNFGIEIELTGITRKQAAQVIADYFGTEPGYAGTYYNTYTATDRQGRIWKAMSDGSIRTERKAGKERMAAGREYSCEVVSPILQYKSSKCCTSPPGSRSDSKRLLRNPCSCGREASHAGKPDPSDELCNRPTGPFL